MEELGSRADGVTNVLILWDGQKPSTDEALDLVEFVAPEIDTRNGRLRLAMLDVPRISYGLASWHVCQDEAAGLMAAGALHRTRRFLVNSADGGQRLVTIVAAPASGLGDGDQSTARHQWAREPLLRMIARHELELRPDLMARPAWRKLTRVDVLDFVLNADADPPQDGEIGYRFRSFEDLDVVVSLFEGFDPHEIQSQLPGGYMKQLTQIAREVGLERLTSDVVHWILCRRPSDGRNVVHMAYVPVERDVLMIMPWDLLSAKERSSGYKLG